MAEPLLARVVVGVDGSGTSHKALRWAVHEAAMRSAQLDVVHAWRVPFPAYADGGAVDPAPFRLAAHHALEEVRAWLDDEGAAATNVHVDLVEHNTDSALVEAAVGADLLVVGSRGRGGFRGLLLGSVSRRCLQRAASPVAVIPAGWSERGDGRVVVGVDGSESSYAALHWAFDEARRRRAELDIVNAYDYVRCTVAFGPVGAIDPATLEAASRALIQRMVPGAPGRPEERPTSVELIPCPDSPARALLDAAAGADLLVVGARGLGGFRGLLLGSVSQQCVHHAPCPVVVVRRPSDGT
jgi:nucleotide-binding universal stress UspA family protein